MADILASLGLDVSGFKASAKEAIAETKDFKKGFGDLKNVLAAGGVTAAVVGFFRAAVDGAEAAADKTEKNAAAVLRFRDSITEAKTSVQQVATASVGWLTRSGELLGETLHLVRTWIQYGAEQVKVEQEQARSMEERAKAEAEANQHRTEFAEITKSLTKIEEQREDLRRKGLTTEERYNVLANEYLEVEAKRINFSGTAIEQRRLELESAEARLAMEKAGAEVTKEQADTQKKRDEEAKKSAAEIAKLQERQAELRFARLSNDEKINELSREEMELRSRSVPAARATSPRRGLACVTCRNPTIPGPPHAPSSPRCSRRNGTRSRRAPTRSRPRPPCTTTRCGASRRPRSRTDYACWWPPSPRARWPLRR
ncbi:MAG TPA: hypothetical protein VHF69_11685 [Candidatus Synoicihabitans sp.]|nr:hypothetical protein [Candidatus Synoicihabitans sp.]